MVSNRTIQITKVFQSRNCPTACSQNACNQVKPWIPERYQRSKRKSILLTPPAWLRSAPAFKSSLATVPVRGKRLVRHSLARFLRNHGDQMNFQKPGFPETRAVTQPETRHYCSGLLGLSRKPRWPDGFPETRLSRNQGSNPARNPALLDWVTEAFPESTVTRWVSRKPVSRNPAETRSESKGYWGGLLRLSR